MTTTGNEEAQCIVQAKCTECGSSNDNYSIQEHGHKSSSIVYELECDCGEETTVMITEDGVSSEENVSYAEASWTDSHAEEEEEDESERLERENDHLH